MPAVPAQSAGGGAAVLPAAQLQRELEALWALAPKLCPVVRPKGMNDMALRALAEREPDARQATKGLQQAIEEAAASCKRCGLCGQTGEASTQPGPVGEAEDPATLRFCTTWRPDFASKTLRLASAQFACGCCRALQETSAFMNFAAVGDRTSDPEESEHLMQRLCSHMIEVNQPEGIDASNPVAAAAWTQEVFATAYAVQVVASNVHGWKITGCNGEELAYRTSQGATAAEGVKLLALNSKKGKRKSRGVESAEAKPLATPEGKKKAKTAKESKSLVRVSKTPMPGKTSKAKSTSRAKGCRLSM